MMYGANKTPFCEWCEAHHARAIDGLGMLVEQAAESFFIWRGVKPETAKILAELRAELQP
jgi:shikimate dehydrogenase